MDKIKIGTLCGVVTLIIILVLIVRYKPPIATNTTKIINPTATISMPIITGTDSVLPRENQPIGVLTKSTLNPNLAVAGLTRIASNTYAPDQVRDTLSNKIHKAVSLGPTVNQQANTLLAGGMIDASGGSMNADFAAFSVFDAGGPVDSGGSIGDPNGEFHELFV